MWAKFCKLVSKNKNKIIDAVVKALEKVLRK